MVGEYLTLIQTIEARRGDEGDWDGGCFTEVAKSAAALAGQTLLCLEMGLVTPAAAETRMTQIHQIIVDLPSLQTPDIAANAMTSLALLGF
jgi:hypothetical protein